LAILKAHELNHAPGGEPDAYKSVFSDAGGGTYQLCADETKLGDMRICLQSASIKTEKAGLELALSTLEAHALNQLDGDLQTSNTTTDDAFAQAAC